MNDNIVIRSAKIEDAHDILKITRQAFLSYIKLAEISDTKALHETIEDVLYDINNKIVIVAEDAGQILGCVRVEITDDVNAYLSRFGVKSYLRNGGIGKAIIKAVDEKMTECGIKKLWLHTSSKISSLVRFYYGRGFYIDSTDKSNGYIRALFCKEYK